jgi:hypothetical protein
MRRLLLYSAAGVALGAFFAAADARAEDAGPCPWWEERRAHGGWATLTGEGGFEADLHGGRGTLSFWRAGFCLEWNQPVASKWAFRGVLYGETDSHDFGDPDAVVAGTGRLFEDAYRVRVEPQASFRDCNGWGFNTGPIVQSAGVPGAEFEDTLTYGGQASVRIPLGGRSAVTLGASVETQLEGSATVWPVFDLETSGTGGRFHVGYLRSGIGSTGIRAAYDVTPRFAVSLMGRLEGRSWRLAEDDRVPGGVFRQSRLAPGLGVMWSPNTCVSLSAEAWLPISDSIRIDDRDGDRVTDFGVDPAPILGLTLSIRF